MNNFFGEPTGKISNPFITLEYLINGGPHIPKVVFNGTRTNLFAETPGFNLETLFGIYHFRGGHRFCHAPESLPRSYIPDNDGLSLEMFPNGVDLIGHIEAGTGIQKHMSIRLSPDRAAVSVTHGLKNFGAWPVETAPWGISMLPLGGTAFLPFDAHGTMRSLSVFSYSKWSDPRLKILDDFIVVKGAAGKPPLKLGYLNDQGWLAYLKEGTLFIKRFTPQPKKIHPDQNVNTEVYVEDKCIELESLSPLVTLQPGESVEHVEDWQWFEGVTRKRKLEDTFIWIADLAKTDGGLSDA